MGRFFERLSLAVVALAAFAGVWLLNELATSGRRALPPGAPDWLRRALRVPAESEGPTDQPAPRLRHRLILANPHAPSEGRAGLVYVLDPEPGHETLAVYRADAEQGLTFVAARRITWDLQAWDFTSKGRGLSVAETQKIIEDERKRMGRFDPLVKAAEERRLLEEKRLRERNEEEARRLREREELIK